ncbi:MAG: Fe-S-containing hydro-lyase [Candidatus Marinimicrobia bacterium]|nr:Fe-S-containing hydro-lyase [Candidatus Neomarinimicrobiota bacterium]
MSEPVHLQTPLKSDDLIQLKVGEKVLISGTIYTARDAAHKRLVALIQKGKELPFNIKGAVIYFVGPAPAPPDKPIGSAGPTTSYRMDPYSPILLDAGLKAMIGKGARSQGVVDSMVKNKAIYLAAIGGAAVVTAQAVKAAKVIAYADLGPEAIRELKVENFPAFVANDSEGNDIYKIGIENYCTE